MAPGRHRPFIQTRTATQAPSKPARRRPVACAAATLAAAGLCSAAQAQSMTAQQFIDACRTNPNHTVTLAEPTKFQVGWTSTPLATPTGCTVVLAPGASFELDSTTMSFGGAFVVRGGASGKVVLDKSTLTARAVTLTLTGDESQFQQNEARLAATGGNLSIQFGEKGFMEVKNSGGWYQPRLSASGRLSLSAGAFFTGVVVGSGLQGGTGVAFTFNGADSGMKLEHTDVLVSSGSPNPGPYTSGPFTVTGHAPKQSFEMIQANLMEASQAVNIAMNGAESKLGLLSLTSQTGSQRISLTAMGRKGEVLVANPLLIGNPSVTIESGVEGSTTYVGSPGTIHATQLITVKAGAGGSCNASAQGLSAPTVQLCF
jgi:hypothetical protein